MNCINCNSRDIISVSGKTSDMCAVEIFDHSTDTWSESNGYVPPGLNIGLGDYIEFDLCMTCGRVQGEFPISREEIFDALKG